MSPNHGVNRRRFLGQLIAIASLPALALPNADAEDRATHYIQTDAESPLLDRCGGLLRMQIVAPARPEAHGAFQCPACGRIHGRSGEAVLPLLEIASRTGNTRYSDAAMAAWQWIKNVDSPDGAWANEADPSFWKGTTVFGAIALAETPEWHGAMLGAPTRNAILAHLIPAGKLIRAIFATNYGSINYAAAGAYGLALLGRTFGDTSFARKGRQLAHPTLEHFTPVARLLFGESQPTHQRRTKECLPVNLGYVPVEEHNMQAVLDREYFRHSCRAEFRLPSGEWNTNLHDHTARISHARGSDGHRMGAGGPGDFPGIRVRRTTGRLAMKNHQAERTFTRYLRHVDCTRADPPWPGVQADPRFRDRSIPYLSVWKRISPALTLINPIT